jgi:exodeoxyribonuclease V alpha subunit
MADKKELEFTGTVVRKIWGDDSSGFRIFAVDVDSEMIEKLNLKKTKYGNISIKGTLHELGEGLDYQIKAYETYDTKNGYSYQVINITRNRPKSAEDMYIFLQEILTPDQAKVMWEAYPDIVQRVINDNLDDIDLNKTCGIKEARFEVIKRKIIENYALAEMVIEFKGLLSMSMIHKLYNRFSSVKELRNQLMKDPYACLCSISGIGFKTADSIALELEKEKIIDFGYELRTSKQRCLGAVTFLLEDNESSNGNTRMDLRELRKQILKLVPACADKFVEALKDESIYYDKDKLVVAKKNTYETEKYIAIALIKATLIKNNKWDIDTSKYKMIDGCELSEEQQQVNKLLCENQVVILAGFAGSGKTYSTQSVLNMCKDNNKTYLALSSTGKAAKVLSEYIGEEAKTVHRGLCYPDPSSPNNWGYNQENKLPYDLVIIDEFSMVDVFLFEHIIDAIDFSRTKLLLVGDPAQCSSVGCGNALYDMIESEKIPKVILNRIFRYADGGLMTVATDVRNGKPYLGNITSTMTTFGKNKDYTFIKSSDKDIIKNLLALYKKILSKEFQESRGIKLDVSDVQVLTAKNVGAYGTIVLNNELQKIANKNYGSANYFKVGDTVFYENDLVIQTQNNYHAELYINDMVFEDEFDKPKETLIANGETGKILEINLKFQYIILDFNGIQIRYYRNDMQNVALGYAITGHRSQGSGIKVPIIVEPRSHIFFDTGNLLYVMLTRCKLMAFHLGLPETVNTVIKKKENLRRNTFMQEFLKGNINEENR